MGLLIALLVFFAAQGLLMDIAFPLLVACIALGSLIDARRKRRERRVQREADEVVAQCKF